MNRALYSPLTKILTFLIHLYITPHSLTLNPGHLGVKLGGRKGSRKGVMEGQAGRSKVREVEVRGDH